MCWWWWYPPMVCLRDIGTGVLEALIAILTTHCVALRVSFSPAKTNRNTYFFFPWSNVSQAYYFTVKCNLAQKFRTHQCGNSQAWLSSFIAAGRCLKYCPVQNLLAAGYGNNTFCPDREQAFCFLCRMMATWWCCLFLSALLAVESCRATSEDL